MTQAQETETHEMKPASHCLNLKPNLSFMAQTERGGESDTSVGDGGVVEGAGREKSERMRGRRRARKHVSDRTQQQQQVCTVSLLLFEQQELLMWDDVTGLHSVACAFVRMKTENK